MCGLRGERAEAVWFVMVMKVEVKGQVFPKVWDVARRVEKLREERMPVNLGGGTVAVPVYEVELPDHTVREGFYMRTPQGVRLYYRPHNQYEVGYLVSELDDDPIARRHFGRDG